MQLVQSLAEGSLDIIGDIHGEYEALQALLEALGYDAQGHHPEGRHLVFVGDLCDRGPDTPAVLTKVQQLVEQGAAQAILGNHELNLLRNDAKEGAGWFFASRHASDGAKFAPFASLPVHMHADALAFVGQLPLVLEREDLRIVHAAWIAESVQAVRGLDCEQLESSYTQWSQHAKQLARSGELQERLDAEKAHWPWSLEDPLRCPPMLPALAEHEANQQMLNPIKVLTSGVERPAAAPFYTSGKWRFAERVAWWDSYGDDIPVVIGHYWRRMGQVDRSAVGKGGEDLFAQIDPLHWHGLKRNVFCVDFSVGGRWSARNSAARDPAHFKLAALRWPENELLFDDGQRLATQGFAATQAAA